VTNRTKKGVARLQIVAELAAMAAIGGPTARYGAACPVGDARHPPQKLSRGHYIYTFSLLFSS